MKPISLLRTVAAFLALAVSPLAAQRVTSPYRFVEHGQGSGLFASYLNAAAGPVGLGPESAAGFGARYGISVSGPFTVELELSMTPTTRAVLDTTYTGPDSAHVRLGDADAAMLLGMANVRFNITGGRSWHRLQPFALFGGGIATDLEKASPADTAVAEDTRFDFGNSFAGQLGAGVEWHLSDQWTLRVDARNVLWKLRNPTAFRLQQRETALPADQWENNTMLTAGFLIRF